MLVVLLSLLVVPVAASTAVAAPKGADEFPPAMRKFIPGSTEWTASPWVTAPSCREDGGDFSIWVATVIGEAPALLQVFNTEVFRHGVSDEGRARNDMILDGYHTIASEMQDQIPTGYCVNEMKRWAGENPKVQPFGFAWGVEATSMFDCTGSEGTNKDESGRNMSVGAERVPCDGFHVRCNGASDSARPRCEEWNAFSRRYVARVDEVRARAINAHPAVGSAAVLEKTPVASLVLVVSGAMAFVGAFSFALTLLRRRGVKRAEGDC